MGIITRTTTSGRRSRSVRLSALALLLPALTLPAARPAGAVTSAATPAAGPALGLPARLGRPSPWTPLVTEDPVTTASVVFPATVAFGPWHHDLDDGLMLLSGDGTRYRRLPYPGTAHPVSAIAPDGRQVAWVNLLPEDLGRGRNAYAISALRLGDRQPRQVVVPAGGTGIVRDLLFDGGSRVFLVADRLFTQKQRRLWSVDLRTMRPTLVCDCPVRLGIGPDGRLWLHDGSPAAAAAGLPVYAQGRPVLDPTFPGTGRVPDAVAADGRTWVETLGSNLLHVVGPQGTRNVVVPDGSGRPERLEPGRVLVMSGAMNIVDEAPFRFTWVDIGDGKARTALTAPGRYNDPGPAVALVATTGDPVPLTASTGVPWWSGDRRDYWVGTAIERVRGIGTGGAVGAAAVLGLVALLVVRRRRRRALG